MQLHTFLIHALDRVLTWDLPDEACFSALTAEAGLLAGLDAEQAAGCDLD